MIRVAQVLPPSELTPANSPLKCGCRPTAKRCKELAGSMATAPSAWLPKARLMLTAALTVKPAERRERSSRISMCKEQRDGPERCGLRRLDRTEAMDLLTSHFHHGRIMA